MRTSLGWRRLPRGPSEPVPEDGAARGGLTSPGLGSVPERKKIEGSRQVEPVSWSTETHLSRLRGLKVK